MIHRLRQSRGPWLALLSIGALAGAIGCTPKRAPGPIVLISIDTLRSDHLPIYGYRGVETPAIDGLRRDGILFERVYSAAPLTAPSHASVLSGLPPTMQMYLWHFPGATDQQDPWVPASGAHDASILYHA